MRRSWADGAELDPPGLQLLLDRVGEELLTAIGLNALDRERHLLDDLFEKCQCAGRGPAGKETQHLEARAVVDGGVLIEAGADLADIDLDAVARDGTTVALDALPPQQPTFQMALAVPDEDLVDGVERQFDVVLADELDPQALHPEPTLPAQVEDHLGFRLEHLAIGRAMRPAAAVLESELPLIAIPAPPFA